MNNYYVSCRWLRPGMQRNKGDRKCRQVASGIADGEGLVIQVTFEQRPEGSKKTSYGYRGKNYVRYRRDPKEGVLSACLKNGVSEVKQWNSGEIREAEGQDAEHGGLHMLARVEAIGGGRQGSNLPGLVFPRMPLMWRMSIVRGTRIS